MDLPILILADTELPIEPVPISLIISCGDISVHYLQQVQAAYSRVTKNKVPLMYVKGNHDSTNPYPDNEYFVNLHNNLITFGGLIWGGLEGSIRYKMGTAPQFYEDEAEEILSHMERADIFVAHNSPFGIHDTPDHAHIGFKALNNYIAKHKPSCVFHGHQHVNQETVLDQTKIFGVYGKRLI